MSAVDGERAAVTESAEGTERAVFIESTGGAERAVESESAETTERGCKLCDAAKERAVLDESTGGIERAASIESAEQDKRAAVNDSIETQERDLPTFLRWRREAARDADVEQLRRRALERDEARLRSYRP